MYKNGSFFDFERFSEMLLEISRNFSNLVEIFENFWGPKTPHFRKIQRITA